jgi:hypothetical protein
MGVALRANFNTPPRLPAGPIAAVLLGFVLFNAAAVLAMYRRFSIPR